MRKMRFNWLIRLSLRHQNCMLC